MALSSMTGFARGHGVSGPYAWAWEIKSVNGKGLDLRLRLLLGWDAVETPARSRGAEALARGTIYANLTVKREGAAPVVRVNQPVLDAVLATARSLAQQIEAAPPSVDGLLALKGVIEVADAEESEDEHRAAGSRRGSPAPWRSPPPRRLRPQAARPPPRRPRPPR